MSYFRLTDKISDLKSFSEVGIGTLYKTGLDALNQNLMLKKGYPLYVGGAPFSGKTEFVLEILVNTSILYKWKHFIYCGEGGNVEHIFYELCHKYLGKHYRDSLENDKIKAEYFVNEHFIICDHDKDYTLDEFYDLVIQAENEFGIKFDTTMFDPFNDVKEELEMFNGREDKFLAHALKKSRISSKKYDRIDILITHIADVKSIQDKDTGRFYMRPALPNEWAGGRTWWRRAFTMVLVYRPPSFLKDANGVEYPENETHIIIQKSKPKGVGKIGVVPIWWDWKKNRYYCKVNGQELYSCETLEQYQPKTLPINTNFIGDVPF